MKERPIKCPKEKVMTINKNTIKQIEKELIEDHFHYSDERDERVKDSGEVFTPMSLVFEMLDELDYDWDTLPDKTFLDPTCGSGNFLVGVAARGVHPKNIYGVDLMQDNVETTKRRLRDIFKRHGYSDDVIEKHLENNIVQGDALEYDYTFGTGDNLLEEW
jgi:2-polyprenyl-3-methyl-5-hydroxy-6-metoxy-1,4-benzoquinol methylase